MLGTHSQNWPLTHGHVGSEGAHAKQATCLPDEHLISYNKHSTHNVAVTFDRLCWRKQAPTSATVALGPRGLLPQMSQTVCPALRALLVSMSTLIFFTCRPSQR